MMIVKRIVTNIHTEQIEKAKYFYQEVLGLNLLMDQGWIATYGSDEAMKVQISFASEEVLGLPHLIYPLKLMMSILHINE